MDQRIDALHDALRNLVIMGMVLIVFVFAVLVVGSRQGRQDVIKSQRIGCVRGLLDRVDNIQSDDGQAKFYRTAADARRQSGDFAIAREYDVQAREAQRRVARRSARLLNGDLELLSQKGSDDMPTAAANAEANRVCLQTFPDADYFRLL